VPPLHALADAGFEIPLVVTRPDKRRGRGAPATPSPVKHAARERGLTVTDDPDAALTVEADLGVVVAYGRLIKPHLLDALPMVNVHFSLLPRWRGAAPVERAILAGDKRSGVCVMAVEEGLDTGDIYARATVGIRRESTAEDLRQQLVGVGTRLLVDSLLKGLGPPQPQKGDVTYAEKLTAEDLRLDWNLPAVQLHRIVRVGGAWTRFRGRRLKVHAAELFETETGPGRPGELHHAGVTTGSGVLVLLEVQPEGKGVMPFAAWANGARPEPGELLGEDPAAASAPV
jgi:methionyl-tRNA formyltransferase